MGGEWPCSDDALVPKRFDASRSRASEGRQRGRQRQRGQHVTSGPDLAMNGCDGVVAHLALGLHGVQTTGGGGYEGS